MDSSKAQSTSPSRSAEAIHGVLEGFFHAIVEAIRDIFILSSKRPFASNKSLFLQSTIWPTATDVLQEPSQTYDIAQHVISQAK